ncbi:hypothetical protein MtrunA17_Chr5g0418091 [Medicago truncatula]|uniref:Uncharacterized protein n=1 Tax=Medicago truncatula TaxID=3880 RepID=A0A396HSH2_MEDTR|nr:hypothetical protein MtrunA17_Chr5g0418091 [Medicago truncatula]
MFDALICGLSGVPTMILSLLEGFSLVKIVVAPALSKCGRLFPSCAGIGIWCRCSVVYGLCGLAYGLRPPF